MPLRNQTYNQLPCPYEIFLTWESEISESPDKLDHEEITKYMDIKDISKLQDQELIAVKGNLGWTKKKKTVLFYGKN